jgi:membrane protein implicated in regulation of membrane protease activity
LTSKSPLFRISFEAFWKMKNKPPIWYTVQAILGWMLEEAILVAVVLWLLPLFNINIPLWVLAILMVALAIYSYIMYRVGRSTFLIGPRVAAEAIIGNDGKVTKRLAPEGYVKVQGVLWKATCIESELEVGDEIVVVNIEGLRLIVSPKERTVQDKKPS